jgi:hypothetical protein
MLRSTYARAAVSIYRFSPDFGESPHTLECITMAKPHRQLKKANHGKRPANAKARKAKRRMIKT